jgi:hypothetical protein
MRYPRSPYSWASIWGIIYAVTKGFANEIAPHHAEGLVDPKSLEIKKPSLTWNTPEHVDSENINLKIGHGRGFY